MKFAIVEGTVICNQEQKQNIDQIATELMAAGHEVEVFIAEDSRFCNSLSGAKLNKMVGIKSCDLATGALNAVFGPAKRELALRSLYNQVEGFAKSHRFDAIVFPEAACAYLRVLSMHSLKRAQLPLVFIIQGLEPKDCSRLGSYAHRLLLKTNIRMAVPRSGKYGFEVAVPNVELIYTGKLAEHIVTLAEN